MGIVRQRAHFFYSFVVTQILFLEWIIKLITEIQTHLLLENQ